MAASGKPKSGFGQDEGGIGGIFLQIFSGGAAHNFAVFVVTRAVTGTDELVDIGFVSDIAALVGANRRTRDKTFIGVGNDDAVLPHIEYFPAADFAQFRVVVEAKHELPVGNLGAFALVFCVGGVIWFVLVGPDKAAEDEGAAQSARTTEQLAPRDFFFAVHGKIRRRGRRAVAEGNLKKAYWPIWNFSIRGGGGGTQFL